MPQPDALLVVGDVLDLVRDRPAVDLAELRQDVRQGLALDSHSEHRCGNRLLQLRSELRDEQVRLERRVADGLGAQRVEVRGQMTVSPVGLDQRHRGGDALRAESRPARSGRLAPGQAPPRLGCAGAGAAATRRRLRFGRLSGRRAPFPSFRFSSRRASPGRASTRPASPLSKSARHSSRDRLGILEVLLEQTLGIARVDSVDIAHAHQVRSSTRSPCGGA